MKKLIIVPVFFSSLPSPRLYAHFGNDSDFANSVECLDSDLKPIKTTCVFIFENGNLQKLIATQDKKYE